MSKPRSAAQLNRIRSGVRVGGKGTPRRKKKARKRAGGQDEKRLQVTLSRLGCSNLPGIEQVNLIKDDGTVIHFSNPKVQAAPGSNTFAISGKGETKTIQDVLREDPMSMMSLGAEGIEMLNSLNAGEGVPDLTGGDGDDDDDDDVPELIGDI